MASIKAKPTASSTPYQQMVGRARNEMLLMGDWLHNFATQFENAIDDGVLDEGKRMNRVLSRVSQSFWDGMGGGR